MAGPSFSTTASGAAIGTAIAPGVGTAIGAGLGFIVDMGNWLGGSSAEASAAALQAKSDAVNYKTQALQTETQIDQTKSDISQYESFLARLPNYQALQKNTFEAQSRQEFKGLLNNFAMTNVAAGASGRVGGSLGLVSEEARFELADYAGGDLALGGDDGGRYEMAKTELWGELDAQESQARDQLGILKTSLPRLDEALGLYNQAASDATARAKKEERAAETWLNPFD